MEEAVPPNAAAKEALHVPEASPPRVRKERDCPGAPKKKKRKSVRHLPGLELPPDAATPAAPINVVVRSLEEELRAAAAEEVRLGTTTSPSGTSYTLLKLGTATSSPPRPELSPKTPPPPSLPDPATPPQPEYSLKRRRTSSSSPPESPASPQSTTKRRRIDTSQSSPSPNPATQAASPTLKGERPTYLSNPSSPVVKLVSTSSITLPSDMSVPCVLPPPGSLPPVHVTPISPSTS
ncbi:Aste57867_10140 [Aphanomyces stellatus]|uniref:Aste57867_10140 protein n=1 Tax=Aphanomyces stellatus TaxID=120398 RepID=A0A485KQ46_9STRA|nr:hypothetical protein As57867_010101 [Aphanomyces stellatus]VFT87016.1 Aste57867_10140 [Aphanomyces stellatus]